MITNHLLEATYKVQKQLDAEAGHDITEYNRLLDRVVKDVEKEYNIKFVYGTPSMRPEPDDIRTP